MTKYVRITSSVRKTLVDALVRRAGVEANEVRRCALPSCGKFFEVAKKGAARKKRYCCKRHSTEHANEKLRNAAQYSPYRLAKSQAQQESAAKVDPDEPGE